MAGRFVRSSKYRHVFGRSTKKEQCFDNIRISKNAWDTNLIKANPKYISVNWEASGGGAFAVIPQNERGRLPEQIPLFRGHTAAVLDTDWSPFDDSLLASGSDDGKVFIWKVPDGFSVHSEAEEPPDVSPVAKLAGHTRKVGHVLFNSAANNILASSSGDYNVKLWDVETGAAKLALKHGDIVQSLSWSADGSQLVTTSRDKKLRIWDARQQKPAHEGPGHSGAKNSRCVWMGELDRIATTGFSRMSDRQLGLWDVRAAKTPINDFMILDSISGVCMPFWDEGTHILYLAGKGDGNIRYYEYENDKFEYLSEFKSPDPQRGIAFMPKRGINLHDNEVARAFKTVNDAYVEPISFIVPRRAEVFQEDIYPPCVGIKPAMSSSEWLGGKTAMPPKISLESVYDGSEVPVEVAASKVASKPTVTSSAPAPEPARAVASSAPTKKEPEPTPASTSTTSAPSATGGRSIKDNQASMSAMASKYADSVEESSDEEGPESTDRGASANGFGTKETTSLPSRSAAATASSTASQLPQTSSTSSAATIPAAATTSRQKTPPPTTTSTSTPATPGSAAEGLRTHLSDIKKLLETQSRTLAGQTEEIARLAGEVETLKKQVKTGGSSGGGDDREKDERIRRLELELESARS